MKVLITGGSGLIGKQLTKKLLEKDVPVVHLTRSRNSAAGVKTYEWNWESGRIDTKCFEDVTHVVHLAGAGIADRSWTMKRKRFLVKSRVHTTRLLHQKITALNLPIEAFISASGVGYYGAQTIDKVFTEEDASHDDFIAKCCIQWENSADLFQHYCRVVKLRTGMVLAPYEGGLPKIASSINIGLGAPLGTGKQAVPWIHIDDMVGLYMEALQNTTMKGVYNAVAPEQITNAELIRNIASAMNKKIRLKRVPSFAIKTLYGEMSLMVLEGSQVSSNKTENIPFAFQFPNNLEALKNIFNR